MALSTTEQIALFILMLAFLFLGIVLIYYYTKRPNQRNRKTQNPDNDYQYDVKLVKTIFHTYVDWGRDVVKRYPEPDDPKIIEMFDAMAKSLKIANTLNNIVKADKEKQDYALVLYKYRESFEIVLDNLKQIERYRIMSADVYKRISHILSEPLSDILAIRENKSEHILHNLEDEIETLRRIRKNKLYDITEPKEI